MDRPRAKVPADSRAKASEAIRSACVPVTGRGALGVAGATAAGGAAGGAATPGAAAGGVCWPSTVTGWGVLVTVGLDVALTLGPVGGFPVTVTVLTCVVTTVTAGSW